MGVVIVGMGKQVVDTFRTGIWTFDVRERERERERRERAREEI
jgi:hypothetical protein